MILKNNKLGGCFICDENRCTGCMACYNVCAHKAIEIKEHRGFLYPVIINSECRRCGKCEKVCPILNPVKKYPPLKDKAYAIFNEDKSKRDSSSSGGVFISLANNVLSKNGVVYGAAYMSDLEVKHIRIDKKSDIHRLQGSKYVQSNIDLCYRKVLEDLKIGRIVLFSGVSCQIEGLRNYLQKDYPNLYACEILCHGGASPIAFRSHLDFMGRKYGSKVTAVNFRYKTKERCQNLVFRFQNGATVLFRNPLEDLYYNGFQNGIVERMGCFKCQHIGVERCGDLVLADFWGVKKESIEKPDDLSYPSLAFVNTAKGYGLFTKCSDDWIVTERPLSEAVRGNLALKRHLPYSKWNGRFFDELYACGYDKAATHCLSLSHHLNYKEFIKKMIGSRFTGLLLKILRR